MYKAPATSNGVVDGEWFVSEGTPGARQVLRAMRDGVSLRRVRHRAPGHPDMRPYARPVPQGSDPTWIRTLG